MELCRQSNVSASMLSRLVITFLPRVSVFNFICSDFGAQKNLFARLRCSPLLLPLLSYPHLSETCTESVQHKEYTQSLEGDEQPVLSADNNTSQPVFKTFELYNVCSLCYKELLKIDLFLNTEKQYYCSWSCCLRVVWASGHMRRGCTIEGSIKGHRECDG